MANHGGEVLRGQLLHKSEDSTWRKVVVIACCGSTSQHSAQLKLFEDCETILKQGQKPEKVIELANCKIDTPLFTPTCNPQSLGPQVTIIRITTPNETHEFYSESEYDHQRWIEVLGQLVKFPYSAFPEELQGDPIEESFHCKLDPAQYGADSVWRVYIFPDEVGTRCAITGMNLLTLQSAVPNRTVGKLNITNPADPSNPLVSWERGKIREIGMNGNLVYVEIGRRCQGGPGRVLMFAGLEDSLTQCIKETLRKFLLYGDGKAVVIPEQQIFDVPQASYDQYLPPSYQIKPDSISSGYQHHKLNTMDSSQDPGSIVSPTDSSEPPLVHLDKHPSRSLNLTPYDIPGSYHSHSSSPGVNANRDTSKPSVQSADSLINEETVLKQEESSQPSLSPKESYCTTAMAKQSLPKAVVHAKVMYTYAAQNPDEINIEAGQVIEILEEEVEEGWLKGRVHGKVGLLPSNHVEKSGDKSSLSPIPEEVKLVDLDRELSETGSWMYLGLYLGLPKHKLDAIYADYGTQGLARCKLEMLESVLNCRGDTLSWDAVVEAVSLTGNNRIAKKIADKHGVRFTATVDTVPISESCWVKDTELQLLKEKVQAMSKKLESGETQFQACSKRRLLLESDFAEAQQNHEFTQKYTNMLVEDRRMFQKMVEQREVQIEYLQSKQRDYERTTRNLEVKLAGASANLLVQQKLQDKLVCLKEQKQNLVDGIESSRREIVRLCEKMDELKQKLDNSTKELSNAESQLKLKNDELFQAKDELKHLKEENDKLLEQLRKQEKDTDVAIVSHSMLHLAVEQCSLYENLKVSRWVEEMDAYIQKLERDDEYQNTSKYRLRSEMEEMGKAMLEKDAYIQELKREDDYLNTSRFGLRREMEVMEEEIQKLKGKDRDPCRGPLPKDVSSQSVHINSLATSASGSSSMPPHPEEDKVEATERRDVQQQVLQANPSTGLSRQINPPLPARQQCSQPSQANSASTVTVTTNTPKLETTV